MNHFTHIVFSEDSKSYTNVNHFDRRRKRFLGEYSLLHNDYEDDSIFLSQFLLDHVGKPIVVLNSSDGHYQHVVNHFEHFKEEDVPKVIEEKRYKIMDWHSELEKEKTVGQLQLLILKNMVEERLKEVQGRRSRPEEDNMMLLGKELELQWVLETIHEITSRPAF